MASIVQKTAPFFLLLATVVLLLLMLLALPAGVDAQTPTPAPSPSSNPSRTPGATPEAVKPITATVVIYGLNLRAGPGTTFARIGGVYRGALLAVHGQSDECGWLRVTTESGAEAWVSGDVRFVALGAECASLPAIAPNALLTPTLSLSDTTAAGALTATVTATVAATASATITDTLIPSVTIAAESNEGISTQEAGGSGTAIEAGGRGNSIPAGQGCARVLNFVGPELTVTFTGLASSETAHESIPNNETYIFCLEPGPYAVTADAPPPWDTINFEVEIVAGQGIDIPLVAQ